MRAASSFFSLAAVSAFLAPVLSHPHVHENAVFARQNPATPYPVVGVPGNVQPRLEIRTMASDEPEMWSIFLLAVQQFKASSNPLTSFYEIAGIHGVPRKSYNNVNQCSSCGGADGYCPHSVVLFPAWHRAYVALLEQEFYKNAQSVAASYKGSNAQAMRDAAARIRWPYWDWAAVPAPGTPVLPSFITSPQITVTGPSGQETIANPLFNYAFQDPSDLVYSPFKSWPNTLRHPSSNAANATSIESDITATFQSRQPNLQDQVYQLLSTCNDYLEFSNDHAGSSSPGCSNSIEAIHNNVHGYLGGPQGKVSAGHMTYLPLAAFDPVFFLHHANVDRIFALWQTIHTSSYGGSSTAVMSTWTFPKGSTQSETSPLEPFYKDTAGNFWNTLEVRDFESTFHYTYPEFLSGGSSSSVAKAVNALYGPNAKYVGPSPPKSSSTSSVKPSTTSTKATSAKTTSTKPVTTSVKTTSTKASTTSAKTTSAATTSVHKAALGATKNGLTPASSASESFASGSSLAASSSVVSSVALSSAPASANGGFNLGGFLSTMLSDFPVPTLSMDLPIPTLSFPSASVPTFAPSLTSSNGSVWQYVANIRYPRWQLDDTYLIYLFDAKPASNNVATWLTDANLIGTVSALAGGGMGMDMTGFISSASIPLTRYLQQLVASGTLASMNEADVLPFLEKNLVWEVVSPKGEAINVAGLPGFQVSVYSSTANYHDTTMLPEWTDFVPQAGVTEHKAGGATPQNIIHSASQAVPDTVDSIGDLLSGGPSSDDPISSAPAEACSGPWYTEYVTVTMTAAGAALPTAYRA